MQLPWTTQPHGFRHGVHPPQEKAATAALPIRQFPFAPLLVVPLQQHAGKAAIAVVREGQDVVRGQLLGRADGWMSVGIHAPATGTVERLALVPSTSGPMVPGVYLKPLPGSTQEAAQGEPCYVATASAEQIIQAIQTAGIVGLGGAAFPTHVKLKIPDGKHVDTLLLNGAECEPWLTTDHRVMLEQADDIMAGIRYLIKAIGVSRAVIGVEANKEDAVAALRAAVPTDLSVRVAVFPVKYPQGAEKMLIAASLGRHVPSGGLPADVGVVVVNVATAAEIGRLLPRGGGIVERVVTIAGPAIARPGNYRIPIGTPLRFALEYVGVSADVARVFIGGPMMGQAVPNLDIPITKGASGFVAFTHREAGQPPREYPCIHCGRCLDACPMYLNPSQLGLLAKREQFEAMAAAFHLRDCFECGACSYVCPSHIPLVQHFRVAKAALRKAKSS